MTKPNKHGVFTRHEIIPVINSGRDLHVDVRVARDERGQWRFGYDYSIAPGSVDGGGGGGYPSIHGRAYPTRSAAIRAARLMLAKRLAAREYMNPRLQALCRKACAALRAGMQMTIFDLMKEDE